MTPALGERARAAAIEATRRELSAAQSEAVRTEAAVADATRAHSTVRAAVATETHRRDLAKQVEALPAARGARGSQASVDSLG